MITLLLSFIPFTVHHSRKVEIWLAFPVATPSAMLVVITAEPWVGQTDSTGNEIGQAFAVSGFCCDPNMAVIEDWTGTMSLLGLVADYGDDSTTSSDSEDESNSDEKAENSDDEDASGERVENALPLPDLDVDVNKPLPSSSRSPELAQRATQSSSVFYNPFLAEEKKKLSVLEKHVQLSTIKEPSAKSRTRSKTCFKFLKGKCRYGDKCKFSHADSASSAPFGANTKPVLNTPPTNYASQVAGFTVTEDEADGWDDQQKRLSKKHRSGVTDSLLPPKRSRAAYEKQQASERPWTMS